MITCYSISSRSLRFYNPFFFFAKQLLNSLSLLNRCNLTTPAPFASLTIPFHQFNSLSSSPYTPWIQHQPLAIALLSTTFIPSNPAFSFPIQLHNLIPLLQTQTIPVHTRSCLQPVTTANCNRLLSTAVHQSSSFSLDSIL